MLSRKLILLLVIVTVTVPVASGSTAAQTANIENGSINIDLNQDGDEETLNESTIIYQLEGGLILEDVAYRDGSTFVTLAAPQNAGNIRVAVSEAIGETGSFERVSTRVPAGGSRTVQLPVEDADITVVTEAEGYYYEFEGSLNVIDKATSGLVTFALFLGSTATILAFLADHGFVRRRYENSYKDVFADERIDIKNDATYEGWREQISAWFGRRDTRIGLVSGVGLIAYTVLAATGVAPLPGTIWNDIMTDSMRLGIIGGLPLGVLAILPAHLIVNRIYEPRRDYVLDLDAEDAYESAAGDDLKDIALYSCSPEMIKNIDIDGSATSLQSNNGRVYLMRNFDPENNTADGSPPELSDDRKLILNAGEIANNRSRLEEYSDIAKDLVSAMPSSMKLAEFEAAIQTDSYVREDISMGDRDGLFGVMEDALEGTSYEGVYSENVEDTELDGDETGGSSDESGETAPDGGDE